MVRYGFGTLYACLEQSVCQCRIIHDTGITGDLHTRYWLIFQVDVDSIGTDLYRFDLSAVNHVNKLIISDLTLGCILYHAGNDIRGKHHNQSNHQKNQNAFAAALLFPIVLIASIVRLVFVHPVPVVCQDRRPASDCCPFLSSSYANSNLSHYKYSFRRNQYIDCEKKLTIMNLF